MAETGENRAAKRRRLRVGAAPSGLPADFLIAPSGQINSVKYGVHAYDQWSVDELLTFANGAPRASI